MAPVNRLQQTTSQVKVELNQIINKKSAFIFFGVTGVA